MRTIALLLAVAPLALAPMAYAQVEPPIPAAPPAPGVPMPAQPDVPAPPAPPSEVPAQPDAPMPPAEPSPEVPQPTPAPPSGPAPIINTDAPVGPMATPRASGAPVATSGGTSQAELATQAPAAKEYPVCSKTVTDNCVNRNERTRKAKK